MAALVIACLLALPEVAFAQEARFDDAVIHQLNFTPTMVIRAEPPVLLGADRLPSLITAPLEPPSNRPSALLVSLYASTAAMQALDVHSTMAALNQGAVEANPLMRGLVRNKTAFIALKASVAASTILATRNMARRNKIVAIATVVGINSAYAMVMRQNYKTARSQR